MCSQISVTALTEHTESRTLLPVRKSHKDITDKEIMGQFTSRRGKKTQTEEK